MPDKPRHPDKDIEKVLRQAESLGWRVEKTAGRGHAWGRVYCPLQSRDGCKMSIWSTPRNAGNHARQVLSKVDACPHSDSTCEHEEASQFLEEMLEDALKEIRSKKNLGGASGDKGEDNG